MNSESIKPIAVYDSGLGGLTILKALRTAFPHEHFIYLGDTAHLPYGAKTPDHLRKLVQRCLTTLGDMKAKMVVVACNSASTVLPPNSPLPLLGVIDAGCEAALAVSQTRRIGVIGTHATINSHAYKKGILQRDSNAMVFEQASPLLVPLVEENWIDDPVTNLIVYRYLNQITPNGIDTLILGCTHYPLLARPIRNCAGPDIRIVDSSEVLVHKLREMFSVQSGFENKSGTQGKCFVHVTEDNSNYEEKVRRILDPTPVDRFSTIQI